MNKRFFLVIIFSLLLVPAQLSAAEPETKDWPKVELYTTDWCPYCLKARNFFEQRGIPYKIYDVEKSREAAFKKKRLAPGAGVPVVVIGDTIIPGYSVRSFLTALELDE
jgi:glutaredoxin